MNASEAPVGTIGTVGHPANGVIVRKVNDTDWIYVATGDVILDYDTVHKAVRALWVPGQTSYDQTPVDASPLPDNWHFEDNGQIECNYCSQHDYIFGSISQGTENFGVINNALVHFREHHKGRLR